MSHSYDVIKPWSKLITCDFGVLIPVSNGRKFLKNQPINERVIVKIKWNLFPGVYMYILGLNHKNILVAIWIAFIKAFLSQENFNSISLAIMISTISLYVVKICGWCGCSVQRLVVDVRDKMLSFLFHNSAASVFANSGCPLAHVSLPSSL